MRAATWAVVCLLCGPGFAHAADAGRWRLGVGITEGLGLAKSGYCSNIYLDSLPAPRVRGSLAVASSVELELGGSFHWLPAVIAVADCAGPWDELHGVLLADLGARFNHALSDRWAWFVAGGPSIGAALHTAHDGTNASTSGAPAAGFHLRTGFAQAASATVRLSVGFEYQMSWARFALASATEWQEQWQAGTLFAVDFALAP